MIARGAGVEEAELEIESSIGWRAGVVQDALIVEGRALGGGLAERKKHGEERQAKGR